MLGQRRRRWSNIKTALAQCLVWVVSLISLVADINAVSLYSTGYCRPTRDRPMHACFAVEWIFKHVLGKKSLSVTFQEKNCLFLIREKKNVMFSCWKEKNNLVK